MRRVKGREEKERIEKRAVSEGTSLPQVKADLLLLLLLGEFLQI